MKFESLAKYRPFPKIDLPDRQWPSRQIVAAPIWCSVDLRDGNQALSVPMNLTQKREMFALLVRLGFKQIEVGFPSASETEFNFLRLLVEEDLIPDDVTVQVLVQAREHLIRRTFESLEGVKRAIVHLYNSTSPLQRRVTFRNATRESIRAIAVEGTQLVKELAEASTDTVVDYQYSPESFSDTELDFALEICEAVMDVWGPTEAKPMILNLPATVEWTTPNVHADQIEWFCRNVKNRSAVQISLHTHNDRGTGIAATELGLLAGADRVEGTLFGNGERTGNLDIVTVALNMNSHGIGTGLDFSNLPEVRAVYERTTGMTVPERSPYGGDLVFTAFSGSHQDAIKKGMDLRKLEGERDQLPWQVPYLTIDPHDIGRTYEAIIRINSQSGKGGIAHVLGNEYGFNLPRTMQPKVGEAISRVADELGRELTPDEIYRHYMSSFANLQKPLDVVDYELDHHRVKGGLVCCRAEVTYYGQTYRIEGEGNGPINAFVHALEKEGWKNFHVSDYRSHAITAGSDSDSAAYVQIQEGNDGPMVWGCGVDSSIEMAGLKALVTAFNLLQNLGK